MIYTNNIKLPYSIEVWKSSVPINLIRNGGDITLCVKKAYLKVSNVYIAEVSFLGEREVEISRFISEEENKELLKRCDKFIEENNG